MKNHIKFGQKIKKNCKIFKIFLKFKKILKQIKKIFIKIKINYYNLRFLTKFDKILLILTVKFKRIMIFKDVIVL